MSHWGLAQNRYFGVRSAKWVPNKSFTRTGVSLKIRVFAIHLARLMPNWSFAQYQYFGVPIAIYVPN